MSGDIGDMISRLLSEPGAQEKLMDAARSLGLSDALPRDMPTEEKPAPQPMMPDLSALGALGSEGMAKLMPMLMKLMPLLGGESRDNEYTRLLCALEPFISGERRTRLGEARRLLGVLEAVEQISK